jgi:hypothetical protein
MIVLMIQIATLAVMVMLLVGLRYLAGQIMPLVEQAKGLLGGGGIGGMLQAVKGTKPMDLITLATMQILPQVAPTIGGFLNTKLAEMSTGARAAPSRMGAAPPIQPAIPLQE